MRKNWHWIELIGFDNESEDYGVSEFLSRLKEPPEGVSLLFSHIDFLNTFTCVEDDYLLRPCECSYAGHLYNHERKRQQWTSMQLKGLIQTLQRSGVKVIFGFFNLATYTNDEKKGVTTEFVAAHPEICTMTWDAKYIMNCVDVLKRMKDGTYYQDHLIEKVKAVLDGYGFDGVQIADGISSFRTTVQNGDYSDDTMEQFSDWLTENGKEIPQMLAPVDTDTDAFIQRRKYVIEHMMYDFLLFNSYRWKRFYDNFYNKVDPKQYVIFVNSFWTREPFEAFYRYGIDYRSAYREGVYALMIEEVSTTYPSFSKGSRGGFYLPLEKSRYVHYEFYLMQMLLKAYVPQFKQVPLMPVGDTMEDWNAVHDLLNELKRAIFRRNNSRVYADGQWLPCAEAPFYCLSDAIAAHDWAKLAELDDLKVLADLQNPLGYALYYPKDSVYGEVKRYIQSRDYGFVKLANLLLANGTYIASVAAGEKLGNIGCPVLALFPEYYEETERSTLMQLDTPVIFVSKERAWGDVLYDGQIIVSARNILPRLAEETVSALKASEGVQLCAVGGEDEQGGIWTMPLRYNEWNKEFLQALTQLLNDQLDVPKLLPDKESECKLTSFALKDGRVIMLVSNDEYYNVNIRVKFDRKIVSARAINRYEGYRTWFAEDTMQVAVPMRTMEIIEVRLE